MASNIFGTSNYSNPDFYLEPNVRGTWTLIQTCFLTLGLCIYSAIHLNVFDRNCAWWTRWLVKGKWMVIALLAPEFVVFNAWSQRRQAARIARLLRRRCGQAEPEGWVGWCRGLLRREKGEVAGVEGGDAVMQHGEPEGSVGDGEVRWNDGGGRRDVASEQVCEKTPSGNNTECDKTAKAIQQGRHSDQAECIEEVNVLVQERSSASTTFAEHETFDLLHGFLIVAGGLAVDMSNDATRVWPESCNILTLTPACIEQCFSSSAFDGIEFDFLTREKINSRMKVDRLAKALVIVQTLWFCSMFFARIYQSLPVSLLELNTFAHAVCALLVYFLWWHKPAEIDEQFLIPTEKSQTLRNLCAAQWSLGAVGRYYVGHPVCDSASNTPSVVAWTRMFVHQGSELVMSICRGRRGFTLCPGSGEDWYILHQEGEARWFYFKHLPSGNRYHLRSHGNQDSTVRLKSGQIIPGTRRKISAQFESVEVDDITMRRWQSTFSSNDFCDNYAVWLRDRQPNFAWPRGLDSDDGPAIGDELLKSLTMTLVTSLCYGGLHLLAWNSQALRPSSTEKFLWKLSSLLIMGLGPLALSWWAGMKVWGGSDAHLRLNQGWAIVLSILGAIALLLYVAARLYLLVEILLVIPYMDPRIYQTPNFPSYWPHIN